MFIRMKNKYDFRMSQIWNWEMGNTTHHSRAWAGTESGPCGHVSCIWFCPEEVGHPHSQLQAQVHDHDQGGHFPNLAIMCVDLDIINPYKTAGCLLFADKEGCPSTMTRTSTTLDKYFCPLHDSLWKSYCRCYCGASPVAFKLIKYVDIWWVGVKIYPMYTSDIDMYTSDIACIHVTNSENILKNSEKVFPEKVWKNLKKKSKNIKVSGN